MRRSILLLLTGVTISMSQVCFGQPNDQQTVKTLRVNPDYARGGTVSQLFDSITYIPLETTKESTFGDIQSLQVSRHYFAFFDYSTKGIFVFDKKGKFVGKITKVPGLNVVWELVNFVLNPYSEDIYLAYSTWDQHNEGFVKLAIFKPNGQLTYNQPIDTANFNGINADEFTFIDTTTTLNALNPDRNPHHSYFVTIKDFKQPEKYIMPVAKGDPFIDPRKSYHRSSTQDGWSFWTRGFDYTFLASKGEQLQAFQILLPAKLSLDSSIYKDAAMMRPGNAPNEFNRKHPKIVTGIRQVFRSGPLQFFTFIMGNSSSVDDSYFYNLNNGNLYSFGKITPDSINGYLPIISVAPAAADSNYVYSFVPSYALFSAKDESADKHPNYSPVMQHFFATENRKSNSVLILLKPKKDL